MKIKIKLMEVVVKKYLILITTLFFLIIPLLYSFSFFDSFARQIKSTDYPRDWYEINRYLNDDSQDYKILFFPWHQYMNFKWVNNTDKRIANPARNFFDKETISGTNVEIGDIYREDKDPIQLYIDNLLNNRKNITNFGLLISILDVKYILLAKEADYKEYKFLFNQSDLELIKDTENLYVFKNKHDIYKIFQTNDIDSISSKRISIDYKKVNPVRFEIGKKEMKYIVLTEPYSEDWKMEGLKGVKSYGVIDAFENDGELRFERFYNINLPSYVISLLTLLTMILIYFSVKD